MTHIKNENNNNINSNNNKVTKTTDQRGHWWSCWWLWLWLFSWWWWYVMVTTMMILLLLLLLLFGTTHPLDVACTLGWIQVVLLASFGAEWKFIMLTVWNQKRSNCLIMKHSIHKCANDNQHILNWNISKHPTSRKVVPTRATSCSWQSRAFFYHHQYRFRTPGVKHHIH